MPDGLFAFVSNEALRPRSVMKKISSELYSKIDTPKESKLELEYLGTAGFILRSQERVIVIDPFVSRPGLFETGFTRLKPKTALINKLIPNADDVLIGHAHHDHVLDAPDLCKATGARFIGSPSACNVARAAGLSETQIRETRGREDIGCGEDARVRGLPSRHGKVYFGRVPLTGEITEPPPWPPRFYELRHGLVLNWLVEMSGMKVVHVDSADFVEEELEGVKADVVCLCAIGRKYRPNYTQTIIEMLSPKYVIACHWDLFFTPFEATPRLLSGVDLPGFIEEIRQAGATPVVLEFGGKLGLGP